MNNIEAQPFGAAEHCSMDNWAAEYAKKLFIHEAADRTTDVEAERLLREKADDDERAEREAADDNERAERKAADLEIRESKVGITDYATETKAGIVTLHRQSGLGIDEVGGLYVCVPTLEGGKYGLRRDGIGQIQIVPASDGEVAAGKEEYKPVTPVTLKKVTNDIKSEIESTADAIRDEENGTYKMTPVKVGEWANKKPIWRVCIPMTSLSELGYTNTNTNFFVTAIDILWKVGVINDTENIIYIEDTLMFQNSDDYDVAAAATNVGVTHPGYYRFSATDDGDYAQCVYGTVVFVADESLIA